MNINKNKSFFTFILLDTVYGSTFFLSTDYNKIRVTVAKGCYGRGTDSLCTQAAQSCIMLLFFKGQQVVHTWSSKT